MPEAGPDWFVEEGIAEHRAVRLRGDRILAARSVWPDRLTAGSVVETTLIARAVTSGRGTARASSGEEILLDRLPRDASEGSMVRVAITRAAFDSPGRLKRSQGRPSTDPVRTLSLVDSLRAAGETVSLVRRFHATGWEEIVAEALVGEFAFRGGTLLFAATPAMTTVDIDGTFAPRDLSLAAVPALGNALRRLDIAGSVVIDFPTLTDKADRRAVDAALDEALADWPHERTAMNGFGLVQIVSRSERPSLLQRATWRRCAFVWRNLLRRAEGLEGAGSIELSIHPQLEAVVDRAHLAELERRSGKRVRIHKVATLVPDAPHAQLVHDD